MDSERKSDVPHETTGGNEDLLLKTTRSLLKCYLPEATRLLIDIPSEILSRGAIINKESGLYREHDLSAALDYLYCHDQPIGMLGRTTEERVARSLRYLMVIVNAYHAAFKNREDSIEARLIAARYFCPTCADLNMDELAEALHVAQRTAERKMNKGLQMLSATLWGEHGIHFVDPVAQ